MAFYDVIHLTYKVNSYDDTCFPKFFSKNEWPSEEYAFSKDSGRCRLFWWVMGMRQTFIPHLPESPVSNSATPLRNLVFLDHVVVCVPLWTLHCCWVKQVLAHGVEASAVTSLLPCYLRELSWGDSRYMYLYQSHISWLQHGVTFVLRNKCVTYVWHT